MSSLHNAHFCEHMMSMSLGTKRPDAMRGIYFHWLFQNGNGCRTRTSRPAPPSFLLIWIPMHSGDGKPFAEVRVIMMCFAVCYNLVLSTLFFKGGWGAIKFWSFMTWLQMRETREVRGFIWSKVGISALDECCFMYNCSHSAHVSQHNLW